MSIVGITTEWSKNCYPKTAMQHVAERHLRNSSFASSTVEQFNKIKRSTSKMTTLPRQQSENTPQQTATRILQAE